MIGLLYLHHSKIFPIQVLKAVKCTHYSRSFTINFKTAEDFTGHEVENCLPVARLGLASLAGWRALFVFSMHLRFRLKDPIATPTGRELSGKSGLFRREAVPWLAGRDGVSDDVDEGSFRGRGFSGEREVELKGRVPAAPDHPRRVPPASRR